MHRHSVTEERIQTNDNQAPAASEQADLARANFADQYLSSEHAKQLVKWAPVAIVGLVGARYLLPEVVQCARGWFGTTGIHQTRQAGAHLTEQFGYMESPVLALRRSTAAKTTGEIPPVFSSKSLDLDKLVPPPKRIDMVSSSPMYDPEQAALFARNLRTEALPLYSETRHAYQPLAADYNQFRSLNTYDYNYWNFKGVIERWQSLVDRHAAKLTERIGIPKPKVEVGWAEGFSRGEFDPRTNAMKLDYREFLRPTKLPESIYHEITHAEQTNLVIRHLCDRLGIGQTASQAELLQLGAMARQEFQVTKGFQNDYLEQVIAIRKGQTLTPDQTKRANELAESMAKVGKDQGSYNSYQDERLREYLQELDSKPLSFTDFLEKKGYEIAPDMLSPRHNFPAVTKKFIADYKTGRGDLSRVDLNSEDLALAGFRQTLLRSLHSTNDLRRANAIAYRTSRHEVEAYEAGELTYGWRTFRPSNS